MKSKTIVRVRPIDAAMFGAGFGLAFLSMAALCGLELSTEARKRFLLACIEAAMKDV